MRRYFWAQTFPATPLNPEGSFTPSMESAIEPSGFLISTSISIQSKTSNGLSPAVVKRRSMTIPVSASPASRTPLLLASIVHFSLVITDPVRVSLAKGSCIPELKVFNASLTRGVLERRLRKFRLTSTVAELLDYRNYIRLGCRPTSRVQLLHR